MLQEEEKKTESFIFIHDSETYLNFHCHVFKSAEGGYHIFEISNRRNDLSELRSFYLNPLHVYVGYNNLNYDDPLTRRVLDNDSISNKRIKMISDQIIKGSFIKGEDSKVIDLFKIMHFDNINKSVSLKWLQCILHMESVKDLPFSPDTIIKEEDFDKLIEYCIHDVDTTGEFYDKIKDKIEFNKKAINLYSIPSINYNEVKIGEFINEQKYRKVAPIPSYVTEREEIHIKEVIPQEYRQYIEGKDLPICQSLLEDLDSLVLKKYNEDFLEEGRKFERKIVINDKIYKMANGGIHSEDEPAYYHTDKGYEILDRDVGSQYPNTIKIFNYYPKHLGEAWAANLADTIETRIQHKRLSKDKRLSEEERKEHKLQADLLKLSLNGGAYGKLNSVYSWQYDPKAMLQVTYTCQLFMLALIEEASMNGIKIISANTDGLVALIKEGQRGVYDEICSRWEEYTGYELEDTLYKSYYCRDVNNYSACTTWGSIKEKGCYEVNKLIGSQLAYHKDHSYRVVRIALRDYIHKGLSIEKTIREHDDIRDFLCFSRAKKSQQSGNAAFYFGDYIDGKETKTFIGKTIRYFASRGKDAKPLFKIYQNGTTSSIMKDAKHEVIESFNQCFSIKECNYKIDYNFYIDLALREIKIPLKEVDTLTLF